MQEQQDAWEAETSSFKTLSHPAEVSLCKAPNPCVLQRSAILQQIKDVLCMNMNINKPSEHRKDMRDFHSFLVCSFPPDVCQSSFKLKCGPSQSKKSEPTCQVRLDTSKASHFKIRQVRVHKSVSQVQGRQDKSKSDWNIRSVWICQRQVISRLDKFQVH